jgi:hypothetical protein
MSIEKGIQLLISLEKSKDFKEFKIKSKETHEIKDQVNSTLKKFSILSLNARKNIYNHSKFLQNSIKTRPKAFTSKNLVKIPSKINPKTVSKATLSLKNIYKSIA